MRNTRFSETEIIYAVKQVEMGISIREIARKYGVCENTIYRWRKKYDGLSPSELRRLKDLERENPQLKKLVAELSLVQGDSSGRTTKKLLKPARKRDLLFEILEDYEVSERRACRLLVLHRSVCRYESRQKDDRALRMRLKELAYSRPRYGYRRLTVLLQREGWPVNHKRIYRIYGEEVLLVRTKRRKKRAAQRRLRPLPAIEPGEHWSIDFVSDQLADGR